MQSLAQLKSALASMFASQPDPDGKCCHLLDATPAARSAIRSGNAGYAVRIGHRRRNSTAPDLSGTYLVMSGIYRRESGRKFEPKKYSSEFARASRTSFALCVVMSMGGTRNAKFLIDNHCKTPQYLESVMLLMEFVGSFQ